MIFIASLVLMSEIVIKHTVSGALQQRSSSHHVL